MNIYKVLIYRFRAERIEYECYFSSFKQAKSRLFWQLTAIGEDLNIQASPKKPCSFLFMTANYTCKITVVDVNRTFGCVLGSWVQSYYPTPNHKDITRLK